MKIKLKLLIIFLIIVIIGVTLIYNNRYFKYKITNDYQEKRLSISDFKLKDFKLEENGFLVSTSSDPWLELKNLNIKIDSVLINAKYLNNYNLLQVFYTYKDNPNFSEKKSIFRITDKKRSSYDIKFIHFKEIKDLRLDLVNKKDEKIKLESIVLNSTPKFEIPYRYLLLTIFLIGTIYFMSCNIYLLDKVNLVAPFMIFISVLILLMVTISTFNSHPDELDNSTPAIFYRSHWLPPKIGDPSSYFAYSAYGVSGLNDLNPYYFFVGKFSKLIRNNLMNAKLTLRTFNFLLFIILLILCLRVKNDNRIIFLPLLITPQVWYLFNYVNTDAYSLFLSFAMIYQITFPNSSLNKYLKCDDGCSKYVGAVISGLIIGLLFLAKKNYYVFILFLIFWFAWTIWFSEKQSRLKLFKKYLIILSIAVVVVAPIYLYDIFNNCIHIEQKYDKTQINLFDLYVNGFNKSQKIMAIQEKLAGEKFKPSTHLKNSAPTLYWKDKGMKYHEIFTKGKWGERSFCSFVGDFGYLNIKTPPPYYTIVFIVMMLFILYITGTILIKGDSKSKLFTLFVFGFVLLMIFIASFYSWTVDFQPQGRYLFPILGIISLWIYENRNILDKIVLNGFMGILFCLSVYSYVFGALYQIPKGL